MKFRPEEASAVHGIRFFRILEYERHFRSQSNASIILIILRITTTTTTTTAPPRQSGVRPHETTPGTYFNSHSEIACIAHFDCDPKNCFKDRPLRAVGFRGTHGLQWGPAGNRFLRAPWRLVTRVLGRGRKPTKFAAASGFAISFPEAQILTPSRMMSLQTALHVQLVSQVHSTRGNTVNLWASVASVASLKFPYVRLKRL